MHGSKTSRTAWIIALATCMATGSPAWVVMKAQGTRADFVAPRTPWGDPDLQGTWPSGPLMIVPFERPPELGTRASLSGEEVAKRDAAIGAALATPSPTAWLHPDWNEIGRAPGLTSLVVDPADGRLPAMTADGTRRAQEWRTRSDPAFPYAGPEDLRPYDRCITRGVLGSAFPNVYSAGMQILQAPGVVIIRHEMVHETRVIPLDGRPHLPSSLRGDNHGAACRATRAERSDGGDRARSGVRRDAGEHAVRLGLVKSLTSVVLALGPGA